MTTKACAECAVPHVTCPDCLRPIANEHDEGNHDTGACACEIARAFCWRLWNGDVCAPLSPYDSKEQSLCKLCGEYRFTWQVFCGAACSAKWEAGERPAGVDDEVKKREPGCKCQLEEGDSPCPVHGEDE